MKEQEPTPGKFFFGFLVGLSIMIIIRFLFIAPAKKERQESIKDFLLHPENYEIHEIYRDSILIDYEINLK